VNSQDPAQRRARLLVVEDDPASGEVAKEMLGALGHECDLVGNGAAFLDAFARLPYDAAFVDLDLPDMTGLELARRARDAERAAGAGRRTPIIALTGNIESDIREACLASGMDDYVAKPYGFGDLRRSLSRCLTAEPAGDAGLEPSAIEAIRAIDRSTGRRVLAGIVAQYLESSEQLSSAMDAAAAQGDAAAVRSAAHTLKGSSAQLGVRDVAARCLDLERRARAGDLSDAVDLIASIRLSLGAVRPQLEAEAARRE
jgi:CheY-like chemotaxis protein/HPt (histidine-containing phosphotransfer) domain-containing protein